MLSIFRTLSVLASASPPLFASALIESPEQATFASARLLRIGEMQKSVVFLALGCVATAASSAPTDLLQAMVRDPQLRVSFLLGLCIV